MIVVCCLLVVVCRASVLPPCPLDWSFRRAGTHLRCDLWVCAPPHAFPSIPPSLLPSITHLRASSRFLPRRLSLARPHALRLTHYKQDDVLENFEIMGHSPLHRMQVRLSQTIGAAARDRGREREREVEREKRQTDTHTHIERESGRERARGRERG